MKISLSWLRDYIAWRGSVAELEDLLTRVGYQSRERHDYGSGFPQRDCCPDRRDKPTSTSGSPKCLPRLMTDRGKPANCLRSEKLRHRRQSAARAAGSRAARRLEDQGRQTARR